MLKQAGMADSGNTRLDRLMTRCREALARAVSTESLENSGAIAGLFSGRVLRLLLSFLCSVTLHYPMPPAPLQDHEQATAWFSRAPAHATVALVNSSSCSSMAAGANSNMADGHPSLCSTAGINSKSFSSNTTESNTSSLDKSGAQQEGATAATDSTIVPSEVTDTYERGAGKVTGSGSSPAAFVVEGAASIQQELHLTADSLKFGNGRAVMQIQQAQGAKGEVAGNVETGVLADRIVLKISSSVGGAGDDVCLQRISVQGVPSNLAAFC